jgi:hypothetical protein
MISRRDRHLFAWLVRREFRKMAGFSSIEAAEKALATLEAFYTATHQDVIDLLKANHMDPTQNNRDEESEHLAPTSVGFDFNHGRNCIWRKGQFVLIDL